MVGGPYVTCKNGTHCDDPKDCHACINDGKACDEQGSPDDFVACPQGQISRSADQGSPGSPVCRNYCEKPPPPADQPVCKNGTWNGSKCVTDQPCVGNPDEQIKCPAGKKAKADGGDKCGYTCVETAVTDNIVGGTLTTNPDGKSVVKCTNDLRKLPYCDDKGLSNWACCISKTGSCNKNTQVGEILADTGERDVQRLAICMDDAIKKAKAFRCALPPGDFGKTCGQATYTEDIAKGTCTMTTQCKTGDGGPEVAASFTYRAQDASRKYVVNDQGRLVDKPPFTCEPTVGSYLETCSNVTSVPDYHKKKCELTAQCKNSTGAMVDSKYEYDPTKDFETYLENDNGKLVDKVPFKCRAYGNFDKTCKNSNVAADVRHSKCVVTADCPTSVGADRKATYEYDPFKETGVFLENDNGALVNVAGTKVGKCQPIGNYAGSCNSVSIITEYDAGNIANTKCTMSAKCKAGGTYMNTDYSYKMSEQTQHYLQNVNGTLQDKPPWVCPVPTGEYKTHCSDLKVTPNYSGNTAGKDCSLDAQCFGRPFHKVYSHTKPPVLLSRGNFIVEETLTTGSFDLNYKVACQTQCNATSAIQAELAKVRAEHHLNYCHFDKAKALAGATPADSLKAESICQTLHTATDCAKNPFCYYDPNQAVDATGHGNIVNVYYDGVSAREISNTCHFYPARDFFGLHSVDHQTGSRSCAMRLKENDQTFTNA